METDYRQRSRTIEVMAEFDFRCARVTFARVAQFTERGASNTEDEGESPSTSTSLRRRFRLGEPLPGGVKVARRFVKPFGVGASPTLAARFS